MKLLTAFILAGLLCVPSIGMGQDVRRDGNWWQGKDRTTKVLYTVGFFDGMDLGHKFSYWNQKNSTGSGAATLSYSELRQKYLKDVTAGQLVDGLDVYYSNFRNRSVAVSNGVWIVLNEISGMPQPELEKMKEGWRRSARD